MVTNYPQQLTATTATPDATRADTSGLLGRMIGHLGQVFCGMRGHDAVLHFESNRVMMRCTSCGHDTPGWEITGQGPRKRFEGDPRRHNIARPQLVLRKTA